jgi:hypothetical protein
MPRPPFRLSNSIKAFCAFPSIILRTNPISSYFTNSDSPLMLLKSISRVAASKTCQTTDSAICLNSFCLFFEIPIVALNKIKGRLLNLLKNRSRLALDLPRLYALTWMSLLGWPTPPVLIPKTNSIDNGQTNRTYHQAPQQQLERLIYFQVNLYSNDSETQS